MFEGIDQPTACSPSMLRHIVQSLVRACASRAALQHPYQQLRPPALDASSRLSPRSIGHSSLCVSAPLSKVGDDLDIHGDEARAIVHSYEIHTGTTVVVKRTGDCEIKIDHILRLAL
jgi:hypothetical protein